MPASIILCHANEDLRFANQLWSELKRAGAQVWHREQDILVGDSTVEKFSDALDTHTHFAIVLSAHSISNSEAMRQLRAAETCKNKFGRPTIIPILVDNTALPASLADLRSVDFRTSGDFIDNLNMLKRSLGLRQTTDTPPIRSLIPSEAETEDVGLRHFIHGIAAQLFSMQAAVNIALESLSETTEPVAHSAIDSIDNGLHRLTNEVAKYRYLLRFEKGIASPKTDQIADLKLLVYDAVSQFKAELLSRDITLRIIDHVKGSLRIRGDAMLIGVALFNVLDNISKHSLRRTTCSISIRRSADLAQLTFQNISSGFEPSHVFAPGYRGANATALAPKGTGTGLTFVAHSVRSHGGEVNLNSQKIDQNRAEVTISIDLPTHT